MKIRVAKPCFDISKTKEFYIDTLGMELFSKFEDHSSFSGVILGFPGDSVHFEFTHSPEHSIAPSTNEEELVILYIESEDKYIEKCKTLIDNGIKICKSLNPYWDDGGTTFIDPNGYRIVVYNGTTKY